MLDYQLICYQNEWIIKEVYKQAAKISSVVTCTDKVEHRIMQKIGKYLTEDTSRLSNKRYIIRMVQKEVYDAINRNRKEQAAHFADLGYEDDSGDKIEFEPVDVLANVESGLLIKETTDLLAKGDRRKEFVLNAWLTGFTNDTELSLVLADEFKETQPSGHRSFIKRFRIECRGMLSATAI